MSVIASFRSLCTKTPIAVRNERKVIKYLNTEISVKNRNNSVE